MAPRTTFDLSNRQRKELLVRGARLFIAIPVDCDMIDCSDRRIVDESLVSNEPFGVVFSCCRELVPVAAVAPRSTCLGTEGVLGQIVLDDQLPSARGPVVLVECVVVELRPPAPHTNRYRKTVPTKWPGRIYFGGEPLNVEADGGNPH